MAESKLIEPAESTEKHVLIRALELYAHVARGTGRDDLASIAERLVERLR